MKAISVIKLTAFENYRGQVLWICAGVALFTVAMSALVSEAAISHQSRLVDVATYFLIDLVAMLGAMYMGTQVFYRDFSARGIAEVAIPSGLSRQGLMLLRLFSHALCLIALIAVLYLVRVAAMATIGTLPSTFIADTLLMAVFSSLKSILALAIGAFLGCFTRPVVALLGAVALFALGHFSTGISGIQGIISENRMLNPFEEFVFKAFRIWNPNYLVLDSLKGAWETPGFSELMMRVGWGIAAVGLFTLSCALAVRRKDIGALRF